MERAKAEENWKNTKTFLSEAQTAYDELSAIVEENARIIEDYNYVVTLAAEETEEAYTQIVDLTKETYTENGKTVETAIARQIQAEQISLREIKKINEEAIKNHNETQANLTQTSIDNSNERLRVLAEQLKGMTSITNENSEDVKNAWKALATDSYDIYAEIIKQSPTKTQNVIQEMTGVVVVEIPTWKEVWDKLGKEGIEALDKDEEFKQQALDSLECYLSGLEDEKLRETLKIASVADVNIVMEALKNGDLSEEQGTKILEGLWNGLGNQGWQTKLYDRASSVSSALSSKLSIGNNYQLPSQRNNSYQLPGHKDGLDYVPYDNYIARLHTGERVLTAEENKQYMADNIENKISNRSIVVQFYAQSMTEQELKRAENYIARKWGMAL